MAIIKLNTVQAPTLAWKFYHWLPCGVDRWVDIRSRDYQNCLDFLGMGLRLCVQRVHEELHYHTQTLSLETNTEYFGQITTFNSHKYRIYIVLPATTLASNLQIPWCGLRILWLGDTSTAFLTRLLPPFTTELTTSTKSTTVFFVFYWFCLAGHLGLKRNIVLNCAKKETNKFML